MPTRARRAAETSSRPARSLARPPQWDSQPKLLSTTQRRASTTKPSACGSRATTRWRIPWTFDHSRQRSAANAPSWTPSRRVGQRALPASSASGVSRSCTEAGTTATASQCPSASTSATRLRPTKPLAASYPRGPRTAMHFTACVSTMASVGPGRLPALRRRRRATSPSRASNRPSSSQRRNQPYTVRHGGQPAGRARQGPPTRRCQAIAPTTRRTGVARPSSRPRLNGPPRKRTSSAAEVDHDDSDDGYECGRTGPGRADVPAAQAGGRAAGGRRAGKREAVLRLLRGEDLETVSRSLGVTVAALTAWRDAFLAAGEAALATRPADGETLASGRLKARPGEMLLRQEPLEEKVAALEAGRPLARRRSRR